MPDLPVVLDISRTISRVEKPGDTGVDRVERAYIRKLEDGDRPVRFLTRIAGGAALLDAVGRQGVARRIGGEDSGPLDAVARASFRQRPVRRRVETAIRLQSLAWTMGPGLAAMLRRQMPEGFDYLNTGHSQVTKKHLRRLRKGGARRIGVLLHDTIPLDCPQFTRADTVPRFRGLIEAVADHADLVICNSRHTEDRARHWLGKAGRVPDMVTAHLGLDPVAPLPAGAAEPHPGFLILGTVEPRKNHRLLLEIWRQLQQIPPSDPFPHLHIVGQRGWENADVFDQLDRAPYMGESVFEHGYLPPDRLLALMAGMRGILFPSFAEGFGFPLIEALGHGLPVIASDLPAFRELAPTGPVFLDPLDAAGWKDAILSLARAPLTRRVPDGFVPPRWEDHFGAVFGALEDPGRDRHPESR